MTAPPTGIPVPQIAAPPPLQTPQQKLEAHIAAIEKIVTAEAAASDAASAAGDLNRDRRLSDQPDYPPPKLLDPPARDAGNGVIGTMQRRLDSDQVLSNGPATTIGIAPPPEPIDWPASLGLLVGGVTVLAWFTLRGRSAILYIGKIIMRTIRHRAALVICLGAILVFADWRIFDQMQADYYWRGAHKAGWIAFFGACTILIGIYHWITGPPTE